jgi:hypothetical protein
MKKINSGHYCDESKKLLDSVQMAEEEFRSFNLPPAIEPLGFETPAGNFVSPDRMKKRREAEENLKRAKAAYQNHIVSCHKCSIKSRQRKT